MEEEEIWERGECGGALGAVEGGEAAAWMQWKVKHNKQWIKRKFAESENRFLNNYKHVVWK